MKRVGFVVPALAVAVVGTWMAAVAPRAAASDPTAALATVAQAPPPGVRFSRATLTGWTSAPERHVSVAALRRAATSALFRLGAPREASVQSGRTGELRWVQVRGGDGIAVIAVFTPGSNVLGTHGSLSVVAERKERAGAGLAKDASRLRRALAPWGAAQLAVRVSGVASADAVPGRVTSAIVQRLGASVVERVSGKDAAVAFGRVPGAPAVSVAGRTFNIEVSVGRNGRGLLVDIGTPLLGPQLGSWAGGLTETA